MRKKFYLLISASFLLLISDQLQILTPMKQVVDPYVVTFKAGIFQHSSQLKLLPVIFISYKSIISDIKTNYRLNNENRELKLKYEELLKENEDFRVQLGAPMPASFQFTPAKIIGLSRYLEIDIGSSNGIKKGLPVVEGETLIGVIDQVTNARSKVLLMTDADLEVGAITSRGSRGIISGQFGQLINFNQVLQKDPLFIEDVVKTSGENGFPQGLLIGQVVSITSDDVAVYKQARIKPFYDLTILDRVFVISEI